MKAEKLQYENKKINIKLILASLWTSVLFLYIYGDYFELYVPGKTEGLLNGRHLLDTPYKLALAAFIMSIPSLMIFLSLVLNPFWSRVFNISTAAFFTIFTLFVGLSSITEWKLFYVMLSFSESFITAIIVWKAWNWPRI
ncbi:MAG: hypothetical protein J0M10_04045 [Chitinophagales bacterium]|nr:hypothetical protein [Chitinophagales bacterium]